MGEVAADEAPTVLLADADVLIDYREADLSVLKEVGTHVARLAVLSETLDEVRGVDRKICAALGIEVIEPETSTLVEAARQDSQRPQWRLGRRDPGSHSGFAGRCGGQR